MKQESAGRWTLAAAVLGSSMVFVDGTVVNVALPRMQKELNATAAGAQWIVEAYALFLAALILVGGSLGDHFGRRKVFTWGVCLFALASVWCGLSPNVSQLIAARVVQGIGGALLTPGSLALISAAFAGEERGKAIGAWSGWTTITSGGGPLLGGWLVQHESWRWVFFLNIPLALAVLALVRRIPESRDSHAGKRLDWAGAALATIGLGGLVYGLIKAGVPGASRTASAAALFLGIAALALFVRTEATSQSPMMPPALFRSRTFTGANLLTLLLYAALGGALFFLPFNLIQVCHYSATAAGAALLPFIALMFALSRWSGGISQRYGAKRPLTIEPAIAALGFALMILPGAQGGSYWTTWFPAILVLGLGMAISVAPLTTAVMTSVAEEQAGMASGVNNAISRVAGLIAVALLGLLVSLAFGQRLTHQLAVRQTPAPLRRNLEAQKAKLAGIVLPPGMPRPERVQLEHAIGESYVAGFRLAMGIAAALALASAAVAWRWIEDDTKEK